MTTTTEPHSTGWCCQDCLFLFANGETPTEMNEDETAAWLADIDRVTNGLDVTLGLMASEHAEDCPNFTDGVFNGSSDEPCEDMEFSWRRCDTCGSHLGGSRHAVTFWLREPVNHAKLTP